MTTLSKMKSLTSTKLKNFIKFNFKFLFDEQKNICKFWQADIYCENYES